MVLFGSPLTLSRFGWEIGLCWCPLFFSLIYKELSYLRHFGALLEFSVLQCSLLPNIFQESCNLTFKLGQDSSKTEASGPELLLRFLTGTHSHQVGRGGHCVRLSCWFFHPPWKLVKWLLSKCSDRAACLRSGSSLLRTFALVDLRRCKGEQAVHVGTERREARLCKIFEITKMTH